LSKDRARGLPINDKPSKELYGSRLFVRVRDRIGSGAARGRANTAAAKANVEPDDAGKEECT
jgi:hypothetical protein